MPSITFQFFMYYYALWTKIALVGRHSCIDTCIGFKLNDDISLKNNNTVIIYHVNSCTFASILLTELPHVYRRIPRQASRGDQLSSQTFCHSIPQGRYWWMKYWLSLVPTTHLHLHLFWRIDLTGILIHWKLFVTV